MWKTTMGFNADLQASLIEVHYFSFIWIPAFAFFQDKFNLIQTSHCFVNIINFQRLQMFLVKYYLILWHFYLQSTRIVVFPTRFDEAV